MRFAYLKVKQLIDVQTNLVLKKGKRLCYFKSVRLTVVGSSAIGRLSLEETM